MNLNELSISDKLVPANYLKLARAAQRNKEIAYRELLEKRKMPINGWPEDQIEELVNQISSMDSNNFSHKMGLGEREARIACKLVARRHYNFGHGIGRSGDLLEPQPKAAGSTLLSNLTNELLLDLIRLMGVRSCQSCFLAPMATGMTLTLCMLALKKQRPKAHYVLWSRIDQKSSFKCMTAAGLTPIIIEPILNYEKGLTTDIVEFRLKINELGADRILCLFSTTSCFAPRNCDDILEMAKMSDGYNIPHLINNAYGLQSTFLTHQLEQSQRVGRVDLFVQSTDKNLMVPVGGAIVAGFDTQLVRLVAKTYPGRASSSQTLDVFMTLLSLGKNGYLKYVNDRKSQFEYLHTKLREFSSEHNTIMFSTRHNPISMALSLESMRSAHNPTACITHFGSMLYTRGVSGVRVIPVGEKKIVDGHNFRCWGAHNSEFQVPYLTVAVSLGVTAQEIDTFIRKLKECWQNYTNKKSRVNFK